MLRRANCIKNGDRNAENDRHKIRSVVDTTVLLILFLSSYPEFIFSQAAPAKLTRPVTTTDAITMTELSAPLFLSGTADTSKAVEFSPDGSRFVTIVKKGNLDADTNDYSLLLFRTSKSFPFPSPEVLVSLSSTSSRPGIQKVAWVGNNAIVFLGERPGEQQQLYRLSVRTRTLTAITHEASGIINYSITPDGHTIAFLKERQTKTILTANARHTGIVVSGQALPDLDTLVNHEEAMLHPELFVQEGTHGAPTKVDLSGVVPSWVDLSLSPDGTYLVLVTYVRTVPTDWKEYNDPLLMKLLQEKGPDFYYVGRLTLVEVKTGQSRPVMDTPIPGTVDVAWSPDSTSLALAGTYLPLDTKDGVERQLRQSSTFVAEVKLPSGEVIPITPKGLRLLRWDRQTNHLILQEGERDATVDIPGSYVEYRKDQRGWEQTEPISADVSGSGQMSVSIEQDLNTPPRIVATDLLSGKKNILFDLNPGFANLNLGRVEEVTWQATDGHQVKGGLYYPAEYQRGNKYPLVIQTHGWNPQVFWMDGPYSTGFIARPLAGKKIFVLQLEENLEYLFSPKEGQVEMSAYEGAIDYLDQRGMINRDRVGIIGFSRTDYHVKYALTHSSYRFAAASLSAGFDAGYFQYITFVRSDPPYAESFEAANGGPPFGDKLSEWIEQSPGFNLDKVRTPVRLISNGTESLFSEWEWFAGLSRLHRPVEMIYLPEAEHIIKRPWERMVSQGGNVDWFCFWLEDHEDPDPAKAEEYGRWRGLRLNAGSSY